MQAARGKLPEVLVACVGGGSNAIGTFYDFIGDKDVRLVGVEAGGEGDSTHLNDKYVLAEKLTQVLMEIAIVPRSLKANQVYYMVSGRIFSSLTKARSSKRIPLALVWIILVLDRSSPG